MISFFIYIYYIIWSTTTSTNKYLFTSYIMCTHTIITVKDEEDTAAESNGEKKRKAVIKSGDGGEDNSVGKGGEGKLH